MEEGQPENLEKMAKNRKTYCYANKGVVNSNREYWPLLPGIITLFFLHVTSNYLLKIEEVSFQAKFCPNFAAPSSIKLGTFVKI